MIRILEKAKERGIFPIEFTFRDDAGAPQAPDSVAWSLIRLDGSIINERENVEIAEMDATLQIVLQGDDLALFASDNCIRRVLIKATYSSLTIGNDLPFTDEIEFEIENLAGIPPAS